MASRVESRDGGAAKLSTAVAILLCAMHALTVLGMAYQERWSLVDTSLYTDLSAYLKFLFVNYGVWLSPIAVVILSMRNPILVGACAVPISIMFAGRLYYLWQFFAYGVDVKTKLGDWAWFLATLIGALSISILAIWLPLRAARFLGRFIRTRKLE